MLKPNGGGEGVCTVGNTFKKIVLGMGLPHVLLRGNDPESVPRRVWLWRAQVVELL